MADTRNNPSATGAPTPAQPQDNPQTQPVAPGESMPISGAPTAGANLVSQGGQPLSNDELNQQRDWRYAPKSTGAAHYMTTQNGELRKVQPGEVVKLTLRQEVRLRDRFEPTFVPTDDDRAKWDRILNDEQF
jgi:hypothetical protein